MGLWDCRTLSLTWFYLQAFICSLTVGLRTVALCSLTVGLRDCGMLSLTWFYLQAFVFFNCGTTGLQKALSLTWLYFL